jgi:hypothetical protein
MRTDIFPDTEKKVRHNEEAVHVLVQPADTNSERENENRRTVSPLCFS